MRVKNEDMEPALDLFGLQIQRKTDVLALTAFLISLLTGGLQLYEWFKGPQISLYPPERVIIYAYQQSGGSTVVRVAATMSYTNSASSQYAGTIASEQVKLTIGSRTSHQRWLSFAQLRREDFLFDPNIIADAAPFPIPGSGSISHSTLFSAFPIDCMPSAPQCQRYQDYWSEEDFAKALDNDHIDLEFQSDVYGSHDPLRVQCRIAVDKFVRTMWLANGSFTENCDSSRGK
jgi:hypothetical protein